jgi:hypothetical protein
MAAAPNPLISSDWKITAIMLIVLGLYLTYSAKTRESGAGLC